MTSKKNSRFISQTSEREFSAGLLKCYAVKVDDSYLGADANHKQPALPVRRVVVLHHNNNWLEVRQV